MADNNPAARKPNNDSDETEMSLLDPHTSGESPSASRKATGLSEKKSPAPKLDLRTLLRFIFPWIWTIVFLIILILMVVIYVDKGVLSRSEKYAYNTVSTTLILFLGLSFYEAFKGLAKELRDHIISWFDPPLVNPKVKQSIEGFDNLLHVARLIYGPISRGFSIFCIAWICINIIAQGVAALISLTYTIDDGKDFNSTYLRNGQSRVSRLDCYFHPNNPSCPFQVTTDALAYTYGENVPQICGPYSDEQSIISSVQNFPYYCRRNTTVQEFAYRINEFNPDDNGEVYPHFTDRVISASSGKCREYDQAGLAEALVGDKMGLIYISAVNYTFTNGTYNGGIVIPTSALGNDGTTYIFRGPPAALNATTWAFGERGLWMWAYKNPSSPIVAETDPGQKFYECPVSLSAVSNVHDLRHQVPNAIARQAIASIALQGQFKGDPNNPDFTQWQWFAYG